ncbi:hypothetical protein [Devosia sp. 919]|uniref:hypothetical protein n=1 Tax=Devosia sp. 919 TaxID=2726065 RepID=UPI001554AB03|nr:hypothetical protein [Devosia sp. 919]
METLRVSATDIDALRYYLNNEDGELETFLAQMRRQTPPTPAMLAGTAFHKALEDFTEGSVARLQAQDHVFNIELEDELDLPALRETKATREYPVGNVLVTLVGKVDGIYGRRIDDHKLTSSYDPERFLSSYQWRIYLEVFEADQFRWNIFEGAEIAGQERVWKVRSLHKLRMYRYPGMAADVEKAVAAFVDFAGIHLPERFAEVAL